MNFPFLHSFPADSFPPRDRCPRVKRAAHVKQENQLASAPAAALPPSLPSFTLLACLGSRSRVTTTRKVGLEREGCGREIPDRFRELAPTSFIRHTIFLSLRAEAKTSFFSDGKTHKTESMRTSDRRHRRSRGRGSDDANERRGERQSGSQVGRGGLQKLHRRRRPRVSKVDTNTKAPLS